MAKRIIFFINFTIWIICLTGLSMDSITWRTIHVNSPYVSYFQLFLFWTGLIITITNIAKYRDTFSSIIWTFCFFCLFGAILKIQFFDFKYLISMLFNLLVIPIGISAGKYLIDNLSEKRYSQYYLLALQIPAITVGISLIGLDFKFNSDCAFAIFLYMPLVFFLRSNIIKISLLAFYGFVILLAAKRSIFMAYTLCIALYVFYILLFSNRNKTISNKSKYFILLMLVIGAYIILSFGNDNLDYLLNRFSNIEKDGGSGRDEVYATIINAFENSDLLQILIGHGYQSVVTTFDIGAHNDLLEILYDYGILSVIIYIVFLAKLAIFAFRNFRPNKHNGSYSFIFAISVSIIIILGMLNCMITGSVYGFINYTCLGMSLRTIKRNISNV